ncbi:MAG: hypothetical protein FJ299_09330 [Planctomycetes bacterium]|nr:hypothetical protein [Planctomycetota bacterium]
MFATLALALAPFTLQEATQPTPAAVVHDLSCTVTLGQPVLVASRFKLKGKVDIRTSAGTTALPFDRSETIEHVDLYESVDKPKAGAYVGQRNYVRYQRDEEKRCKDPEWAGVRASIECDGDETRLSLNGRLVRPSELDRALERAPYTGAWLPLPKAVALGASIDVDALAIAHVMHVENARADASAKLRLAAVDAAGVATITGDLVIPTARAGEPLVVTHAGTCTIRVDTARHKVIELRWDGDAEVAGADASLTASGKLPFEFALTATFGEPAEKALAQKPVYRECDLVFERAKLALALPSHFFAADEGKDPDVRLYRSAVEGAQAPLLVELKAFDIAKADQTAVIEAAMKAMRDNKSLEVLEERAESSALGKGKLMRYVVDGEEQWMAVLPCGEHALIRIKVLAAAANKKLLPGTWSKLKGSLKLVK